MAAKKKRGRVLRAPTEAGRTAAQLAALEAQAKAGDSCAQAEALSEWFGVFAMMLREGIPLQDGDRRMIALMWKAFEAARATGGQSLTLSTAQKRRLFVEDLERIAASGVTFHFGAGENGFVMAKAGDILVNTDALTEDELKQLQRYGQLVEAWRDEKPGAGRKSKFQILSEWLARDGDHVAAPTLKALRSEIRRTSSKRRAPNR